jgi:hypothetical protein
VQKPVQPVAGKFRDYNGVHKRGDHAHESDMQTVIKHDFNS